IGAVAGLLVAPRTGKQTRQLLKKSASALPEIAEDLSSSLQMQADRLSESATIAWDDTLVRLKEAIAAGLEASQLEKEKLSKRKAKNSSDSSPPQSDRPSSSS
ncbi:MAG: YtxH domain-containing protein, partial [Okeania sp. SIO2H7]|nr:YtxH domain-containing protein [Okeania sp. SIO2H7]